MLGTYSAKVKIFTQLFKHKKARSFSFMKRTRFLGVKGQVFSTILARCTKNPINRL